MDTPEGDPAPVAARRPATHARPRLTVRGLGAGSDPEAAASVGVGSASWASLGVVGGSQGGSTPSPGLRERGWGGGGGGGRNKPEVPGSSRA